jgi:hypothetical protein
MLVESDACLKNNILLPLENKSHLVYLEEDDFFAALDPPLLLVGDLDLVIPPLPVEGVYLRKQQPDIINFFFIFQWNQAIFELNPVPFIVDLEINSSYHQLALVNSVLSNPFSPDQGSSFCIKHAKSCTFFFFICSSVLSS